MRLGIRHQLPELSAVVSLMRPDSWAGLTDSASVVAAARVGNPDGEGEEIGEGIVAQAERRGWHVVDMCEVLDALAVKRNQGCPTYELPAPLADLDVRYIDIAPTGALRQGGLFSLDGVHPTTSGYAVIASEFIRVMNAKARAGEPRIPDPDFAAIRAIDSLVSFAPGTSRPTEVVRERRGLASRQRIRACE
jgi:hypothetical protein